MRRFGDCSRQKAAKFRTGIRDESKVGRRLSKECLRLRCLLKSQRAPRGMHRANGVAHAGQHASEVRMRQDMLRVEIDRPPKMCGRFGKLVLLTESPADMVLKLGVVGIDGQRLAMVRE